MAYVRTVKTASGATAAQIVWSSRRGSRSIEHIGSAHDEVELAALKAAAAERLAAGQAVLDLGVAGPPGSEPLPITSSHMTHLWEGLSCAYRVLGFESVTKGDNVFRDLVLARIIEPTSNVDAGRVLGEVGVEAASYATVKRRLPPSSLHFLTDDLHLSCTTLDRQCLTSKARRRRDSIRLVPVKTDDRPTLMRVADVGCGRDPSFAP